jgi:hypothetical protein
MNELIQLIFTDFYVDGISIPVKFLKYDGKSTTYVTYMETDINNSYSGDNEILPFSRWSEDERKISRYPY